jgi:hypothetical protein
LCCRNLEGPTKPYGRYRPIADDSKPITLEMLLANCMGNPAF